MNLDSISTGAKDLCVRQNMRLRILKNKNNGAPSGALLELIESEYTIRILSTQAFQRTTNACLPPAYVASSSSSSGQWVSQAEDTEK